MDMVERVARAICETLFGFYDENDDAPTSPLGQSRLAARAAIAAMSEELLAHFQGAVDSPALGAVEKYRVSVCMDDIRQIMHTSPQAPSSE